MTLREFRMLIRYTTDKRNKPTAVVKSWLTPEQLETIKSKPYVAERNAKQRNPSYWTRIFIRQAWQIMFPGEPEK